MLPGQHCQVSAVRSGKLVIGVRLITREPLEGC